jgi:hypothetical protein
MIRPELSASMMDDVVNEKFETVQLDEFEIP